jgi:hypothetical protein
LISVGRDVADIDFDDLTSPKLNDIQRQILQYTEARPVDFGVDQIIAEAIEQAGVGDLDDVDGLGDRLAAHVAAIEADQGLTQLTRASLRQRVVRLLRNRLSLTELLKRYPEIESIEIEKPFIVVGMPRSGTTHLVNLIAADPRRRALPYWESQEPIPAAGDGPDIFGVDPRYARAKAEHDALMASAPVVAAMHDRFPEAIEEEVELLDLDLAGYVLEWHARVPGWRDFYLSLDQRRHYAYMKKVLQALTFLRGPRDLDPEKPAALRATRSADRDIPGRDSGFHASRSGRGDPVGDHDDGLLRSIASDQHRPGLAVGLLERPSASTARRLCARPRPGARAAQY